MSDSVTPWIAARQASLSITNSQSSLKLTSIESVMPSSHLILCRPLLLPPIPPSIRDFSSESTLRMRWPDYWSFSFSIIPSKEIPGLISFRMKGLESPRDSQESSPTPQFKSTNSSVLSFLHSPTLTVSSNKTLVNELLLSTSSILPGWLLLNFSQWRGLLRHYIYLATCYLAPLPVSETSMTGALGSGLGVTLWSISRGPFPAS